jgi:ribonuclease J
MPNLTFYGGLDEIGGNKILLEDRGTRILLDFGKSFKARSNFYDWTERPRQANGIGDFIALGILPAISGIYREDLLKLARLPKEEDRFVQAAILSHAHADHADYLSFLREDIPIYMGQTTKDILCALEEEKSSNIEFEITSFKKRPTDRRDSPVRRDIRTFRTGAKIKIDSIEIEPIHVDHSLPGCYGLVITTSGSTIVYSGDLRMHGNLPNLTTDFIERAKARKPEVMLCEGTRINESSSSTEKNIYELCMHYIMQAKDHFVFAEYSYKDLDRFTSFYNLAKNTGRRILINPKTARYLAALSKNTDLKVPKIDDETLVVYKSRLKSGSYSDSDYDKYDGRIFENGSNVWTCEEVKQNESKVIMCLGSYHLEELIDIRPERGIYLHSASEPFNEEGEIDEKRIENWIGKFGLVKLHAHCSGHASAPDLNYIVNQINPKSLIPIHTEHPELFLAFHSNNNRLAEPQKPIAV